MKVLHCFQRKGYEFEQSVLFTSVTDDVDLYYLEVPINLGYKFNVNDNFQIAQRQAFIWLVVCLEMMIRWIVTHLLIIMIRRMVLLMITIVLMQVWVLVPISGSHVILRLVRVMSSVLSR